jgi:UDPglucose 6-dehydrogenase
MKISVFGSGYVGLVAGTCFADVGNEVICVDIDQQKIDKLKQGVVPIYEPGLELILKRNIEEERISFTTDLKTGVEKSTILIIAVGTPPDEDGSADLKHVLEVATAIGKYMNEFKVVVNKSTVPVGTAEKVAETIRKQSRHNFAVVSNPEFLKEGDAIEDFMQPERIIIGTSHNEAAEIMRTLYQPFVRNNRPIIVMDEKSAELTKYAANSLLATKISFMNELANLCDHLGADVDWVRKGIGADARIGPYFIFPGTGYGGSCFPKDVKAIIKTSRDHDFELKILKAVEEVNEHQKTILLAKIEEYFKNDLKNKVFAMWGLSFKPGTDDMREAPSINMINALTARGARIQAHDPEAMDEARRIFAKRLDKDVVLFEKHYDCLNGADALIVMTEWNQFREPDFLLIKELLKSHVVFDGRNIYHPSRMRNLGIDYYCIGRASGKSRISKSYTI